MFISIYLSLKKGHSFGIFVVSNAQRNPDLAASREARVQNAEMEILRQQQERELAEAAM